MDKQVCDGCKVGLDDSHRCRAKCADSCVDGEKCPDYIGEGNCACPDCHEVECKNVPFTYIYNRWSDYKLATCDCVGTCELEE